MQPYSRPQGGLSIVMTFLAAAILTIIPLPEWMAPFRPEWMILILIYWCMALPNRVGVFTGWGLGLLMDVLKSATLGQHALAFSVIAYLTLKIHRQIRVYPAWQQALSVMALVVLYQMLLMWINGITGVKSHTWLYWLPVISSTLLWPWLYLILRDLRRHFGVR